MNKNKAYEYVMSRLTEIEQKHNYFFQESNLTLLKCVKITGTALISVHIINLELPENIQDEIELIFWID